MNVRLLLFAAMPLALFAKPVIDDAHDRVQTTYSPGYVRIGTLTPRSAKEVGPSRLALGCEMLPRDYGDFDSFKEYMPPLGLARVRLHAGWAKLEPEPGKWNWEWLDHQVNWLIENGLVPLLETSYGNPCYPGAGGASLSDGMPHGEVALKAWDNYVDRLSKRYPQVKDWACWNEPSNGGANSPEAVADNNIRTAEIIRRNIPDAKIGMLVLSSANLPFTKQAFRVFRERDAFKLFHWAIMHDYSPNPDVYYEGAEKWAAYVRQEAPHLKIWNGESGATSDPHYSAPVSSFAWNTELTQAKWDARRLIGDLGHGFESLVFTMYDPCYDCPERYTQKTPAYWVRTRKDRFMKRMGLVKCNDRLEVTKVKMAYYTVQNVATLFDANVENETMKLQILDANAVAFARYTFVHRPTGIPLVALWNPTRHPVNENTVTPVTIKLFNGKCLECPVLVDMVTGAIYEIPADRVSGRRHTFIEGLPVYDAPIVVTERRLVMP